MSKRQRDVMERRKKNASITGLYNGTTYFKKV